MHTEYVTELYGFGITVVALGLTEMCRFSKEQGGCVASLLFHSQLPIWRPKSSVIPSPLSGFFRAELFQSNPHKQFPYYVSPSPWLQTSLVCTGK